MDGAAPPPRASLRDLVGALRVGPFRYGNLDTYDALLVEGSVAHRTALTRIGGFVGVGIGFALFVGAPFSQGSATTRVVLLVMGVYAISASLVQAAVGNRLSLRTLDVLGLTGPVALALGGIFAGRSITALPHLYVMLGTATFAQRRWGIGLLHTAAMGASYAAVVAIGDGYNAPVSRWLALMAAVGAVGGGTRWLIGRTKVQVIEARRARAEVERANAELAAADAAKSAFLARMSHELRTPLNAVVGFADVVRDELVGPLDERQRGYLDDVASSGRELVALVDEVLDLDRVESGRLELELDLVDVGETVGDGVRPMAGRAAQMGIDIELHVAPDLSPVWADARKVRQVVRNLVANALRFTARGGRVDVWVAADPAGGAVVTVRDDGVGIAVDDLERIFEPYEQAGHVRDGTGLGLPLARRFVERHGGRLDARSEVGAGSEFRFVLPPRPPDQPADGGPLGSLASAELVAPGSSANREFIVRFGVAFSLLAAVLCGAFVLTAPSSDDVEVAAALGGTALVIGAFLRLFGRQAPRLVMTATGVLGIVAISALVWNSGPYSDLAPLAYLLPMIVQAALSERLRALVQLGIIAASYAVVLVAGPHQPNAVGRWAITVTMLVVVSTVAWWVVDELRQLAVAEAEARRTAERLRTELAATGAHKRDFVAGMSHELRTPLNAIIGFSDVLLSEMAGPLNEKQREYVGEVLDAGRHLLTVVDDILDLAKLEAGRLQLLVDELDGEALVLGAAAAVEGAARAGEVGLDVHLGPELGSLRGDEARLHRVLVILLSNAVKFTDPGGRVVLAADAVGDRLHVTITDTGVGIVPDQIERIFEAFHQSTRPIPAQANEGPGVGLALAQALVGLHGGSIEVVSEVGHGSRFTVRLPRTSDVARPAVEVEVRE